MCAVFGVAFTDVCMDETAAAHVAFWGIRTLQHRAQESAGIAVSDGENITHHKAMGLVEYVFNEDILARLKGRVAISHTRYSTTGDSEVNNAHPIVIGSKFGQLAAAHNGDFMNAASLRRSLVAQGAAFQSTTDTEVVLHLLVRSKADRFEDALQEALRQVGPAYAIIMLKGDTLIGARDPLGIRPLVMGIRDDGGIVLASETTALDFEEVGARFVREVEPGEIVVIENGKLPREPRRKPTLTARCVFEQVYFAAPNSVVFGRTVQQSRERMGEYLAQEHPTQAEIVVPVPDSGIPAAAGYAHSSGIPFSFALIRDQYVGRTFIAPGQRIRSQKALMKFRVVSELVNQKRVVLVDDSLVRGTTMQKLIAKFRKAGALEVHVRISCPPTMWPCFYGVDTPTRKELIATTMSLLEICEFIGADSLGYLSLDGLLNAVRGTEKEFCAACFTGRYPTELSEERKLALQTV